MTWAFGQRVGSPITATTRSAPIRFPRFKTIAAETEMNERSVRRHVKTLDVAGLIACRAQGRGKAYSLSLPPTPDRESDSAQPTPDTLSSRPASVSVKADSPSITPDRESTEPGGTASNRERVGGRARKRTGRATRLPDDWQPNQAEFYFAPKEGLDDGHTRA